MWIQTGFPLLDLVFACSDKSLGLVGKSHNITKILVSLGSQSWMSVSKQTDLFVVLWKVSALSRGSTETCENVCQVRALMYRDVVCGSTLLSSLFNMHLTLLFYFPASFRACRICFCAVNTTCDIIITL